MGKADGLRVLVGKEREAVVGNAEGSGLGAGDGA